MKNKCPICKREYKGSLASYDNHKMCIKCLCKKFERKEIKIENANELKENEILAMIFGNKEKTKLQIKADEINERIKEVTWTAESGIVYKVFYCGMCDCYAYSCPEEECMGTGCNGGGCDKCSNDHDEWYKKKLNKYFEKCRS